MTRRRARAGLRDRWLPYACTAPCEVRSVLLLLYPFMSDGGYVPGVSRKWIAETLDITPDAVSGRIKRAKKLGLLDRRGGGYSGHPADYEATIPANGKVVTQTTTFPAVQDRANDNLFCPRCGGKVVTQMTTQRARVTPVTTNVLPLFNDGCER
jgi:hypothetical protein